MGNYDKVKDILFSLCSVNAVSGDEAGMLDLCKSLLPDSAEVTSDINGNIIAVVGDKNADETLLLDAHLDQIGMRVTDINGGFLRAAKCGGLDSRVLQGSAVTVHGKRAIPAVISSTPPHLSDGNEGKACGIEKLWIDTGLDELETLVSCGDAVTLSAEPKTLLNNRVSAVGTDNRAGVTALIRAAHMIEKIKANRKIILLFSSREEVNALGARTAAFSIDAQECISVDVSFARQPEGGYATPGVLGEGPMLCLSSTLDKELTMGIKALAEREEIRLQTEVCAGATGTNADHISVTKGGIRTALLSIPQANMHTQAEIVDLSDIENLARLLAAYALRGGNGDV